MTEKQINRRISLALVGLVVLITATILTSDNYSAMTLTLLGSSISLFGDALIPLLLGVIVSSLIAVFVQPEDIQRFLPSHIISILVVSLFLGILFPFGEYGVIPIVRRLFKKGLPLTVGIIFLLSAPIINPIFLASMYIVFGLNFVFWAVIGLTIIVALSVGIVFAFQNEDTLEPQSVATPDVSLSTGLLQALAKARFELAEMLFYLIIGAIIASVAQILITQDNILLWGNAETLPIWGVQLLGFVEGANFVAHSEFYFSYLENPNLVAITVALTFGTMLDIKTVILLFSTLKPRFILYLTALSFLATLLIGLWLNLT